MIYDIPLPRLLDQNMQETRRLHVLDASLELSNTPLSTAKLILSKTDTLEIRQWVSMYTEMGFAGIFRVRAPSHNYRLDEKEYELDHGIAELGDYVIRTELEIENTAASTAIQQIFASYGGTLWQLGTVAATDTISYSGSGDNVLSALLNIMNQLPGYELDLDQSSLPWTVSVIAKPQTISGEGRLARNVKSCRISEDDQNLCTRIISPDLPNGALEADTISIYGPVERYAGKAAETSQAQFEADCARYLAQHKHPLLSITIDLQVLQQITGEPLDGVKLGSLYRLALPDYNITQDETVERLYWPSIYGNPGAVQVTLANEELTLSSAYASASKSIEKNTKETQKNTYRWIAADEHITEQGTILHEAGLEIDPHGVWAFAKEEGALGTMQGNLRVQSDAITAEVTRATEAEGTLGSRITETAEEIKAEVYAANSTVYSYIQQTASSITAKVEDTEAGLYSYVQQTASGFRQTIAATTNRTWVQDSDPRSQAGGEHTPKVGDIWIESTHQGSWDGAEGYDWEHDEGYDWSQIMGARIWTWQNDKWELASDKQQVISYTDLVNTAENLISQKIAGIVNDEGLLDVYLSKLEQTATAIRSEVYTATSETYSYIQQTTSSIALSIDAHIQKTYIRDFVKNGQPEIVIGEDGIARDADGRQLRDGDVWINTADQDSWDKALNWTWNDDTNYNWSDLRDAEILRYDAATKSLVQVVNGRVFTDPLEMEIADDRIKANMRSIDVVNGKVEENAHQLSVTTTELRSNFNDRISNVNSDLQQTKNQLSSVYAETIRTSEWQNWYEGTGIFQNRERINAVAGKFKVDSNGNVHVIDGSGLYLGENAASLAVYTSGNLTAGAIVEKVNGGNAKILANKLNVNTTDVAAWGAYTNNTLTGGILVEKLNDNSTTTKILGTRVNVRATDLATWGVYTDDTLTAGIIVDKINGGNLTIQASKINLSGYVTASQLQATNASISNLTSGKTQASKLWASYIDVNDLHVSDGGRGSMYYMGNKVVSVNVLSKDGTKYYPVLATNLDGTSSGYSALGNAITSFGTATSSGGSITIPTTKLDGTAGPSINFNIADTKYYKDQVSAIKTAVSSALGSAAWNTSSNVSTSIYASLDTSNKVVKVTSAVAKITYPGDSNATSVSIGLGNLDVSSALNSYATTQKNSVTISSITYTADAPVSTYNIPITMTATASNGNTGESKAYVNAYSIYTAGQTEEAGKYSAVTFARGNLNSYNGGELTTLYDKDGKSVGARFWYWSRSSDVLSTLYSRN